MNIDTEKMLDNQQPVDDAKKAFQNSIKNSQDFRFGYWTYAIVYMFETLCCCLKSCCTRRYNWWRINLIRYKKFEIAK